MDLTESFEKTITDGDIERWRYPRFFTANIGETQAEIRGDDAKHIAQVLRMKSGDKAILCDNAGNDYLCTIVSADKELVILNVSDKRQNDAEPPVKIRLYQCLPKSDKMEFIVQKATELGATDIIPVLSKRCVSRPNEQTMEKKIQRYAKIVSEASKQCGRGHIPDVHPMVTIKEAICSVNKDDLSIIFYECGGEKIDNILSGNKGKNINVFIGSEGGFEKNEVESAVENGFCTATLGKRILRCETAPIAALSILMNLTDT